MQISDRSACEVNALYARLAPRLERALAASVHADAWVLEEACQVAWIRLLCGHEDVAEEHALGWLATTARREALRTLRRLRAQASLDEECARSARARPVAAAATLPPQVVVELRERLLEVQQLPLRQRRLVWLQAVGYDYSEIAERSGESYRSVERQLRRAKRTLAAA
jgi:RNA polymerase sigma factor (sigma-70 family)